MNTASRNPRSSGRMSAWFLPMASVILMFGNSPSTAATVTLGPATTIAGDADVFAVGGLSYAYALSNSAQTVNGVAFDAGASTTTLGGGNVTMSGFDGANNTTAFGSASGSPWNGLSTPYKEILRGGNYSNAGTSVTVNLNNLTSGHVYATQLWVNDNRSIAGRTETVTSAGGNTVTLDYSSTDANGGVGQHVLGGFTADAATQALTLLGNASTQLNAIQVRDVTGVWSGAANGNWDAASANFTGGQSFTAVSGLGTSVYFADTDGFKNAVTNSSVAVQAGGVSIGSVNFQNNAVTYTLTSADANGITGSSAVIKSGSGTVVFAGNNTYSGTTTISSGTLKVGDGGTAGSLGSGTVTNNGALIFSRSDTSQLNPAAAIGGTGTVAYNGPAVAVSAQGQYIVDDANSYTGATSITNARVNVTNGSAFGSGAGAVVTVNNGGQIYTTASMTINNPITINGNGWLEPAGTLGAIRMNGGTIAGAVTMASNSRISSYGGSGTISGAISGAFNLEITGQAIGNLLTLTGANSYTGTTTINVGTVQIGNGGTSGQFGGTAGVVNNAAIILNRSNDFSVPNAISGGGTVTKTGAGTATLTGANTYTGATVINAGTLAVSAGGISNPSDFIIGNSTGTAASFTLSGGTVSLSGSNLLTASAASTPGTTAFTYTQSGGALNFTNAGGFIGMSNNGGATDMNISGGTFTAGNASGINLGVRGNANLNLSGSAIITLHTLTYGHPSTGGGTSTVNLNGGTLAVGAAGITRGSGTAVFNFNGGTLQPTAASANFLSGLNTANVRNGGAVIDVAGGKDSTVSQSLLHSTIGGDNATDGGLTKNGTGILTLSGSNTYTGATLVNAGTLKAGSDSAFGAAGNTITVSAGASIDINARTLQGYTQNIQIAGAGASASLGALGNSNAGTNVSAIRGITLTGDASIGGDGGRWDIGRIDFDVNPAITVDHITGNNHVLTKVGTSYLGLLTGASNLAGFVISGGTVAPHENTSFGAGPVTMNPGTILQPWGGLTQSNVFNLAGGTIQTDGFTETFTGAINVTGAVTVNPRTGGNIFFNGNVSGAGSINKTGPFSFFLSGDNSGFTGTLTNSESNTMLNSATAGSASASFVVNSGTLNNTTAGAVTHHLGSLAGSGGLVGNNISGSNVTFSIGANNASTAYSGTIVDSVGGGGTTALTKVGSGTLTLSGANTYSGDTSITGGTLLLGADNVLPNGSALKLNGGTLNSDGHVDTAGALTLLSDSTIDFGSGTSSLTFSSATISGGILSVWNWTGTVGATGGTDQLKFTSGTAGTDFPALQFYSGNGTVYLGPGRLLDAGGGTFEMVPVPEAGAVFAGLMLLLPAVLPARRRSRPPA